MGKSASSKSKAAAEAKRSSRADSSSTFDKSESDFLFSHPPQPQPQPVHLFGLSICLFLWQLKPVTIMLASDVWLAPFETLRFFIKRPGPEDFCDRVSPVRSEKTLLKYHCIFSNVVVGLVNQLLGFIRNFEVIPLISSYFNYFEGFCNVCGRIWNIFRVILCF